MLRSARVAGKNKRSPAGSTYVHKGEDLPVDDLGGARRPREGAAVPSGETPLAEDALAVAAMAMNVPSTLAMPVPEEEAPREEPAPDVPAAQPRETMAASPRAKGIPPPDPRTEEVELLVARNAWADIKTLLERDGNVDDLPPELLFVWAIADKETSERSTADGVAIEAMARILRLPTDSALALVLAKRTLRKRTWGDTPAPRPWLSALIAVLGIGAGAAIGYVWSVVLF